MGYKICEIGQQRSPSDDYYVDVVLKVWALAGNAAPFETELHHFVNLVHQHKNLQYSVGKKVYYAFKENENQLALCKAALQVIHYTQPEEVSVDAQLHMVERVVINYKDLQVKQLAVSCLAKIYYRHHSDEMAKDKIRCIIGSFCGSPDMELQ